MVSKEKKKVVCKGMVSSFKKTRVSPKKLRLLKIVVSLGMIFNENIIAKLVFDNALCEETVEIAGTNC